MAETLDKTEDILELVESCINQLSVGGRLIWTPHDIDPVVDNLLELWGMLHNN